MMTDGRPKQNNSVGLTFELSGKDGACLAQSYDRELQRHRCKKITTPRVA
jgi:hypothetical protein